MYFKNEPVNIHSHQVLIKVIQQRGSNIVNEILKNQYHTSSGNLLCRDFIMNRLTTIIEKIRGCVMNIGVYTVTRNANIRVK